MHGNRKGRRKRITYQVASGNLNLGKVEDDGQLGLSQTIGVWVCGNFRRHFEGCGLW